MKSTYLKHLLIVGAVWTFALVATGSGAAQEVRIIKASPASLMPRTGRQITMQPKPISGAQKLLAVQNVVKRHGKTAGSLGSPLLLSPTKLTAGPALIGLDSPSFVRSKAGIAEALFGEKDAGVLMTFTPPTSGLYLLDFTVSAQNVATFTLTGNFAMLSKAVTNNTGHLLFVADAVTPNQDIYFKLSAEGVWSFLSCEISPIK